MKQNLPLILCRVTVESTVATGGTVVIFSQSRRLQKNIRKGYLKISGKHLSALRVVYLLRYGLLITSDIFFKRR